MTASRILVVDDEADIRGLLKEILSEEGYEVEVAADATQARSSRASQVPDLVLLDIKNWDEERHRRLTGMEVGPVLDFARRLANHKRPMWLRYVFVPGWSDDAGHISQLARFAASLGNVERVDVLPFHQMGSI